MQTTRTIEVFSAGCPACDEAAALVRRLACPACEVKVLDMKDPKVSARAKAMSVKRVPAIVVDGVLADCCKSGGAPDEAVLRAMGVGRQVA